MPLSVRVDTGLAAEAYSPGILCHSIAETAMKRAENRAGAAASLRNVEG